VNLLRLLRARHFARTNGPDGLVRNHHVGPVALDFLFDGGELAEAHVVGDSGFAFFELFTDAGDDFEAFIQGKGDFLADDLLERSESDPSTARVRHHSNSQSPHSYHLISLVEKLPPLRVPQNNPADPQILQDHRAIPQKFLISPSIPWLEIRFPHLTSPVNAPGALSRMFCAAIWIPGTATFLASARYGKGGAMMTSDRNRISGVK